MAISNIAQPLQKYVAGYNPVVFANDSTNKTQEGFRYIYDVYSAGTSDLLASYQIAPRYGDGYGVLHVERVLQDYLTFNFQPSGLPIKQSWVAFDVKVGESYGSDWSFTDYQFADYTGTTYNGYTELINSGGTSHPYLVGESINVTQYSAVSSTVNGIHTVLAVPASNKVVIDVIYDMSNLGFEVSGTTTFANNRRATYRDLYTYSGFVATNTAVPFITKQLAESKYVMTGTSADKKFLTSAPNGTCHTLTEDLYFNIINNYSATSYYLRIRNSNGETYRYTINNTTEPLVQLPVGPNNVTGTPVGSATLPIIKDDTTYYDLDIVTVGAVAVSETFRICIDRRCPINYGEENGGDISIAFLDRLGSFGSFAFQLKKQDNTSIKRDMYYQQFGDIVGGEWYYNITDFGDTVYNVELSRSLTLNTNWMSEADAQWFDELVSSPVTYIKWNGAYQSCTITDTQTERAYQRNQTLMRKTITIAFANNDTINI